MSASITRKAFDAKVDDVSATERTVTAVITTDDLDAYNEIVLAAGGDLKRYRKNPVVLWSHNRDGAESKVPIGKNLWIKPKGKDGRALVACTKFAGDERGERYFKLYEEEILRAWSIGFDEDREKCGPPNERELRAHPAWAKAKRVYRAWTLLEYSAVPVGANPEALTTAVSKGLWLPESLKAQVPDDEPEPESDPEDDNSEPELPPFVGRSLAEIHADAVRRFKAAAAGLARDEADRIRGRV